MGEMVLSQWQEQIQNIDRNIFKCLHMHAGIKHNSWYHKICAFQAAFLVHVNNREEK